MKNSSIWAILALLVGLTTRGQSLVVSNDGDDSGFAAPTSHSTTSRKVGLHGGGNTHGFDLTTNKEEIIISSLPASTSPNVTRSRLNAMVYLAGGTVPTDRTKDVAAFWEIPEGGLKWWDIIQTEGIPFWMGEETHEGDVGAGQFGHNLVTSLKGKSPVGDYWVRVLPSTSLISGAFFQVGRDAAGKEIPFNQNFVGINWGPNGVLDSMINSATGIWEQRGDDEVYSNGQLPSSLSHYDEWCRFGSRTFRKVSDQEASLDQAVNLFENGDFAVKFELLKRGEFGDEVVATKVVSTIPPPPPAPTLTIKMVDGSPAVTIQGTKGVKYNLELSPRTDGPWAPIFRSVDPEVPLTVGNSGTMKFFRAVQQ